MSRDLSGVGLNELLAPVGGEAMKENATMDTLPIDVRGKWYEVPVPVHLHVIGMRENVRIATEHPANSVRRALLRFVETTEDEGTTDLPRDVLNGLVAFGYLTKRRAGRYGYFYEMTPAGDAVVTGAEAAMNGANT